MAVRSAGAHRPRTTTRGWWTEQQRTVRRPASAGRSRAAGEPAVVSHGHGAAVVEHAGRSCSPPPCPSSTPACGPATWSRSPARRTRSPCSARRAGRAGGRRRVRAADEPARFPGARRAHDVPPVPGAGHRRGRPAARDGCACRRGRLRRRPRRLAGGPALRVGLQPAPRRRPGRPRSASTTGAGSPPRSSTAPRRPTRSWSRGTAWSASAGFQDPGAYVPVAPAARGPRSRTATRSSPSRTPPPWPVSGTSSARCSPRWSPTATSRRTCTSRPARSRRTPSGTASGRCRARVWADGDLIICVISDRGTSLHRPVQRLRPRARPRPLPRRHGPVAGPQALGPRRRAAHRTTGLSVRLSTRLR